MLNVKALVSKFYHATKVPGFFILLWLIGLISIGTLKLFIVVSILLFIVIPFIFKYSRRLQQSILFLTFIAHPPSSVLKSPQSIGLYGTRHFYLTHRDPDDFHHDIHLGVWHILPNYITKKFAKKLNLTEAELETLNGTISLPEQENAFTSLEKQTKYEFGELTTEASERIFYERMLQADGSKIFLYLHGNTGSRAAAHRVELYKLLRELGFHIIAFDYRSYGDSTTRTMSEAGVVRDAVAVYKHITHITTRPVFAWGHSLGTGIVNHMMASLNGQNAPSLVILESPFSNIRDEVRAHPFSKLHRHLPWFGYTISDPMYANYLRFESDKHIAEYPQPVMILHAEDDLVVPFELGYKLFRQAVATRNKSWGPVEFHRFDASSQYGHKYLFRAPELPELINGFVGAYGKEVATARERS